MLHIIVNPVAGRSGCVKTYERLKPLFASRGVEHKALVSQGAGDVTRLAESAVREGAEAVVVIGGDGTVAEAACALGGTGAVLGIIPGGTGNDLALSLGIPRDPERALDVILSGHTRDMDAGSLNGRTFVNVAGTGFDVLVARNVSRVKRWLTGLAGYGAAVFLSIATTRPKRIRFETPQGVFEREILLIAFANGRYYGGGMLVAPQADMFDGMLDICIINAVPRWKIPILLTKFVKGKHLLLDVCEYFKAPWIKLSSGEETTFNLDGDIAGEAPAEIRLVPGALKVFAP